VTKHVHLLVKLLDGRFEWEIAVSESFPYTHSQAGLIPGMLIDDL
jgi:hypothetical protein